MNIQIYLKSANHPHYAGMLKQFAKGIPGAQLNKSMTPVDCDVAVIFGSWKDRQMEHHVLKNRVIAHQRKIGKPFVVVETPLIGRKIETEYQWYRIGINHFLNTLGDFKNDNSPSDRWEMFQQQGIQMKPWRTNGSHIVVALQIPGDASLLGQCISEWAVQTVDELRKYTDRPIIIRPHKLVRNYKLDLINACVQRHKNVEFVDPNETMTRNDFDNCWATITYTSGYAIDSLLNGIPTFAMHEGNMAYPLCSWNLSQIESFELPDRTQWIQDLSYAQWSIKEMSKGLPWCHLFP